MNRTAIHTIGGTKFNVSVEGKGSPLILLHGAYCNLGVWDEHVELLSRSFTVIRYDQRGYGRSDAVTGPFSHYLDLKAILDHFGLRRVSIVGSCSGGGIAIDFALAYPDYVEQLVLISPSLNGTAPPLRLIWERMSDAWRVKHIGIERASARFFRSRYWRHTVPRGRRARARLKEMYLANAVHYRSRMTMQRPLLPLARKRLHELECPVLIVEGEWDSLFNRQICRYLRSQILHASLIRMEGCGHFPQLEQPLEFSAIALSALKASTSRR
ncbi:alpha/beta fold hydrolase [Saccharibacillus kuerlensis]|uniref:Alpha/beta hydrolase n=1 Tax=Saccharibacillus kuerlensis TaxID=459527 RepID=A0ABQ2LBS0_9BACL|nr:alpha/beta hydrolase [Saccharibacillus kuerlensis]GGO09511.1 alpha/beta hydrolase [Saccharibacillus kuerlensis]